MPNRRNAFYLLLIASLAVGLITGRSFLFNLAYVFGAILVVSLMWAWLSVQWISVLRRTRSTRSQVGGVIDESFAVINRSYLPRLWLEVRDHSTLSSHNAGHIVPAMAGRSTYTWHVQTPCQSRGEFQLGPMTIVSGDPFGFFVYPRTIPAKSKVIVFPQTVPVDRFTLPAGALSGGEAQRQRTHYVTTNAAGVREYAYGDSFNRIHWKSSARRDQLMVKEFELDPMVDLWLMIDFSAASLVEEKSVRRIGGVGPVVPTQAGIPASTEEYGVVAAASLAEHFVQGERAVGFIAYVPQRIVHHAEHGMPQLTRILNTLATARSFSTYTLQLMLSLENPHLPRGATLIVITSSADTQWVSMLHILSSRGIRPAVVFVDPASFGGASGESAITALRAARIPLLVVKKGDDMKTALSKPMIY
ncbi:MAG: DUF58 domain-containing protein [Anaerolineae bacterium]|nr:DUF58 domain-containing protein [Anaerolineae bacterium]